MRIIIGSRRKEKKSNYLGSLFFVEMSGFGIEHHCLDGEIGGMLKPVRFLNVTLIHS